MRAFILNALDNQTNQVKVYEMVVEELKKVAIIVDSVHLQEIELADCKKCYHCWTKKPGVCIIEDKGIEIAHNLIQSDLFVILTPTKGEEVSPLINKAMERTIPNLASSPNQNTRIQNKEMSTTKHKKRPSLIGIGIIEGNMEEAGDGQQFYRTIARIGINYRCVKTVSELIDCNDALELQQQLVEETVAIGVKHQ